MAETIKIPGIGPVKKTWVYVGVGTLAGILLWAYYRRASSGGGEEEVAAVPVADAGVTDYAQGSDASGYNVVYPPSTGAYAQYGYDLYGNPLPAPTGIGGGAITTNSDWVTAGVGTLVDSGVEQGVATTALTRVLGGLSVTAAQRDHFMQAVGTLGQPPQGYPTPIKVTDPGTEPKPPPPTTLAAVTGLRSTGTFTTHVNLDWNPVPGAEGYTVYRNGARITSVVYSTAAVWGMKPGHRYTLSVEPFKGSVRGPKQSVSITTKK